MHLRLLKILLQILILWTQTISLTLAANREVNSIILPTPPGSYSLGVKSIEFQDIQRTMLRDSKAKRWVGTLLYPSKPHRGLYPYQPFTLHNGEIQNIRVLAHSKPNAIPLKGRYPLILFIPGRGADRDRYTILGEGLASSGAIILALDQPYVAGLVRFKSGEIFRPTLKDLWMIQNNRDYRYSYDDLVIKETMGDLSFVIDHLSDVLKVLPEVDISKIIVIGHSIGGNSAHIFGFKDSRINAVIDIDSKITDRAVFGRNGLPSNPRGIPVLFIRGMMQYQDDLGSKLDKIKNASLWKPYVEHDAFSDNVFFASHIPHFGEQGLIKNIWTLFFTDNPFTTRENTSTGVYQCDEWIQNYRHIIISWLKKNNLI